MKQENKSKSLIALLIVIITGFHYLLPTHQWVIHDFLRRLYYLPIILAAFQFRLKGAFIVSILSVVLYAPHLIIYFGEINLEVINQFLEIVMFMVIGLITGYLVEQDYKRKQLLEQQIVKLADLENYTHNILDSIASGVVAINCEGEVTSKNRQASTMFGDDKDLQLFFDKELLIKEVKQVLTGNKQKIRKEIDYTMENGKSMHIQVSIYPLSNILHKPEGTVVVIDDVTMIKTLEIQVRRGERLAAIGELASGIAHEIRNPLGIIKTISQTLIQDVQEEFREGLIIIEHEIDRANRVIKGLLDYSRPNKIKVEAFQLEILLSELLIITKKFGQQKGVAIDFMAEDSCKIEGDTDKLKQAFMNIILNGIQAMANGGGLKITLHKNPDEGAIVTFKDEGEGIPKELLDKIFNPFFTTKESGTGLGLSITHRIIEEHQGHIQVKSQVGEGTEVSIHLPLLEEEGDTV
ncbi:two-component system sensor histidine kinase NtrB [Natronincola peptidivorans]|nr:ATP-binding protein [Natronincola peptidivorans]